MQSDTAFENQVGFEVGPLFTDFPTLVTLHCV